MLARGEGNTVQYPVSAHGSEAPLSLQQCTSNAPHKHSLGDLGHNPAHKHWRRPQRLTPFTSEKKKEKVMSWFLSTLLHYTFEAAQCIPGNNELLSGLSAPLSPPTTTTTTTCLPQLGSSSSHFLSRVTRARLFLLHRIISCIFYSSSVTVVSSNHGLR